MKISSDLQLALSSFILDYTSPFTYDPIVPPEEAIQDYIDSYNEYLPDHEIRLLELIRNLYRVNSCYSRLVLLREFLELHQEEFSYSS